MPPLDPDRLWADSLAFVRAAHASGDDARTVAFDRPLPALPPPPAVLDEAVAYLRRMNFALWHIEDEARRRDLGDSHVAEAKRRIDAHNQARNDAIEAIDAALEAAIPMRADAPPATETPGAAIDRLTVLALKVFHTEEEAARADASDAHRAKMRERLAVLEAQGADLRAALRALLDDAAAGRRRFRRYRQFKMYNDPETNPAVRGAVRGASP